jgi:amino acid transporter
LGHFFSVPLLPSSLRVRSFEGEPPAGFGPAAYPMARRNRSMAKNENAYPVRLKGELTQPPSRALWLVKWLLIIPHLIVLAALAVAFAVVTVIAFFAILFKGKYPRSLFDFNVGVLRWGWRVAFYSYGALGTDVYPPFTLKSFDYPADLEIDYPETLKNWMVLVKWFLAVPHYAVLAALAGWGASYVQGAEFPFSGLQWVLVLIVAILLLFTGKYHQDIFRLIMGINRWVYRVVAYVGLMTDRYPHFRLWD